MPADLGVAGSLIYQEPSMKPNDIQSPRILVTRLSAIGDNLLTFPMLLSLKHHWPQAKVLWVVDCAASHFLQHHPDIDQVMRLPKGFLKRPQLLRQVVGQLRSFSPTIANDPQGLFKSALLTWLSGAKTRIGFDRSQAREAAWCWYSHRVTVGDGHMIDKQFRLAKAAGAHLESLDFGWQVPIADREWAESTLAQLGLSEQKYLLFNPGSAWPSKNWSPQRFGEVAGRMWRDAGWKTIMLWGNDKELQMAQEAAVASDGHAILAPATTLTQAAALVSKARLVLSGDTSVLHVATMLGRPSVSLFGPTLPHRSGPYWRDDIALQKRYHEGSSRQRRRADASAILEITSDEVVEAITKRLGLPDPMEKAKKWTS
ncbi:MAG: glycosyltransferase family 9 protein [Pirellulaceae bacterium]